MRKEAQLNRKYLLMTHHLLCETQGRVPLAPSVASPSPDEQMCIVFWQRTQRARMGVTRGQPLYHLMNMEGLVCVGLFDVL